MIPFQFSVMPGDNQGLAPSPYYKKAMLRNPEFGSTPYFNTDTAIWTPPAGIVAFSAHIYLISASGPINPSNVDIKVYKNPGFATDQDTIISGTGLKAGIASAPLIPQALPIQLPFFFDQANGTDQYCLAVYLMAGNGAFIDPNPLHSRWTCIAYGQLSTLVKGIP